MDSDWNYPRNPHLHGPICHHDVCTIVHPCDGTSLDTRTDHYPSLILENGPIPVHVFPFAHVARRFQIGIHWIYPVNYGYVYDRTEDPLPITACTDTATKRIWMEKSGTTSPNATLLQYKILIRGGATWGIRILDLLITSQPHYRAMQRWRYGCIRTRILMVLSKGRNRPFDTSQQTSSS